MIGREHFAPYLRNQIFSQIWDLYKNVTNNIKFRYRPNSEKKLLNFLINSKKPYFWPIFGSLSPFWRKKYFFRKTCLLWRTPYGPLTPYWVTENTIEPIPRKLPYGRTDRPLFIGPFQQQLGVQLKAKYIRMFFFKKCFIHKANWQQYSLKSL